MCTLSVRSNINKDFNDTSANKSKADHLGLETAPTAQLPTITLLFGESCLTNPSCHNYLLVASQSHSFDTPHKTCKLTIKVYCKPPTPANKQHAIVATLTLSGNPQDGSRHFNDKKWLHHLQASPHQVHHTLGTTYDT
jgi:hypothetical protein